MDAGLISRSKEAEVMAIAITTVIVTVMGIAVTTDMARGK
jgi:preprotein translocase subunit Sec61beta